HEPRRTFALNHPLGLPTRTRVTSLFLACFAFGLIFTVVSFLLGMLGGTNIHVPGLTIHLGTSGGAPAHHDASGGHGSGVHVSPFNVSTLSAFLTWFGGAGYLLSRYSGF